MLSLNDYVVCKNNQEAFDLVENITDENDEQIQVIITGPKGSGKTSLLQHRKADLNLLSPKKILVRSADELATSIRLNAPDSFFEALGTADVLFIDNFQAFLDEGEIGEMFPGLLLKERKKQGLDTILVVEEDKLSTVLNNYEDELEGFSTIKIGKLDKEARKQLISKELEKIFKDDDFENMPNLTTETLDALSNEEELNVRPMLQIAEFLARNNDEFTPEEELTEVQKLIMTELN